MKSKINLELLAKVLGVHSVGSVTSDEQGNAMVVYRETEEDNSSWYETNSLVLMQYYKSYLVKHGFLVASGVYSKDVGFALYLEGSEVMKEISSTGEPKAVRLMAEYLYEKYLT